MSRLVLLLVLCLLPGEAWADRGTLLQLVGVALSLTGMPVLGFALLTAGNLVRASDQRRALRRENARQRQKANDSMQDRTVTVLTAEPPYRAGYGRCQAGGDVLAIFTTDKVGTREDGSTYTKPDALKHLVIHFSSRQIQAIHEVYIENVPVGALSIQPDGSGVPTGGEFATARNDLRTVIVSGTLAIAEQALEIVQAFTITGTGLDAVQSPASVAITGGGFVLDSGAATVTCTYRISAVNAVVRISKFLGTAGQTVDAYLNSLVPAQWTANHRGRGRAGIVITLDLEDQRFQGGVPNITVDASWSLVYDRRLDSTVPGGSGPQRANDPSTWTWSDTAALCVDDWLCSEMGYAVDRVDDIDGAYAIAAANACDVPITLDDGAGAYTGKTYTCNGTFTSDASREGVLEDLTQCMAGWAVPAGQWLIIAGAWAAPVRDFVDDDLNGSIEVLQADTGTDALLNGARGRYVAAGKSQPTEANPPYSNPVFVAADQGKPLVTDFQFPYTDSNARVRNLLRIKVEKTRSGLIIQYPAKLRHWGVRVGERVWVTSKTYLWARKAFRVTDRRYTQQQPVVFTLQEDDASIWDQADSAVADPTPNTGLGNPYAVAPLAGLALSSGTSTLQRTADGTIVPRVLATWTAITDNFVVPSGQIELFWRRNSDFTWQPLAPLPGNATSTYISGVEEGDMVLVHARVRNQYGKLSDSVFKGAQVVGKGALPANVGTVVVSAVPGAVLVSWPPNTEVDYLETEVRVGASWAAGTQIFKGAAGGYAWPWPAAGSYTLRVKHRDTSRNESTTDSTAAITVNNNVLMGPGEIINGAVTEVFSAVGPSSSIPDGTTTASVTFTPLATGSVIITVIATVGFVNVNATPQLMSAEISIDLDGTLYATERAERTVAGSGSDKVQISIKEVFSGLTAVPHTAAVRFDIVLHPGGTAVTLAGNRAKNVVEVIKR